MFFVADLRVILGFTSATYRTFQIITVLLLVAGNAGILKKKNGISINDSIFNIKNVLRTFALVPTRPILFQKPKPEEVDFSMPNISINRVFPNATRVFQNSTKISTSLR